MLIIRDDNGFAWTLADGRVCLVMELDVPNSGYLADNWDDAVAVLNEYGYLGADYEE